MITHGGYLIPLNVCPGLVNMDMQPPTNSELSITRPNTLPQTIITSDLDWRPSSVDYEYDDTNWFDAMDNLPDLDHDLPVD